MKIRERENKFIEIVGWQEDLSVILSESSLMVAPLRFGAGVKGKIYSAIAARVPVVTTSIGAEGTGLEDGVHLRVADEASRFADEVILLLTDNRKRKTQAEKAFRHIYKNNSLNVAQQIFSDAIDSAYDHFYTSLVN